MASTAPAGSIRIDGLKRLRRDLKAVQGNVDDLKDVNQSVATLVAGAAAVRSPRKTGTLAGSGRGNRAVARATVTFGGAQVPYAGPIHYGWPARNIQAQPFIIDAAQATEAAWMELYLSGVQDALEPIAGTSY